MMARSISKKPIFNLNLVLQETGIKADTLRAWERRYNLPQPDRSEGGHRLFSEYDIETIKWLIARQEEGMRISRAVELWNSIIDKGEDPLYSLMTDQTVKPAGELSDHDSESLEYERNRWIQACLAFNESAAEQILTQSFAQFSLETVCVEILQAGLSEIGSMWYEGKATVQQEHFASELAVRRLHALISAAPPPVREETILVSCPEGENHIFSPLLLTLLLRYRSWNVIYLGANVPNQQFKETIQKTQPDLVVMTAMLLNTAASLLDAALFIRQMNIPVAFGGGIFSLLPSLVSKIPGYYLGNKLRGSISAIEDLMIKPLPPLEYEGQPDQFTETIEAFSEKKELIENQVIQQMSKQIGGQVSIRMMQNSNQFLAKDILAALSLGDMYLLGSNIEWIQALMVNRNIEEDMIFDYLQAYHDAVDTHLGSSGRPISEWLTTVYENGTSVR